MASNSKPELEGVSLLPCRRCAYLQPDFFLYCGQCGESAAKACSACQRRNPQGFVYCGFCGHAFDGASPGVQPEHGSAAPPTLKPELGPELSAVDSASEATTLRSAVARMTELRQVVIIFCDLCGFTAMSEKLEPEDVANVINPLFQQLSNCLLKYGGTIEKFIGDAIMALFGVPISHEDDAERALLAALEMRQIIERYCSQMKQERHLDLNMRIGLNMGNIVAGSVIDENGKANYTVLGDAINVAARLEQNARPGHVLVAEGLYQLTQEHFDFSGKRSLKAKGKSENLIAYELQGVKKHAQRQRGGTRAMPFVGRKKEWEILKPLVAHSSQHRFQSFAVMGEAGLGKSRLIHELCEFWQTDHRGRVIIASSPSYSREFSYFLLKSLLKNILNLDEQASLETIKMQMRLCLGELQLENAQLLNEAMEYLLLQDVHNALHFLDAEYRQARLFQSLSELVHALARQKPLILFLDDLQWADRSSLEWIVYFKQYISSQNLDCRLCIAATWRDEKELGFLATLLDWEQVLELQPLDEEEAETLFCHLLNLSHRPPELALLFESVLNKAAGNPYFLEEVYKVLIREQFLALNEGQWLLSEDISQLPLPESLQSLTISYFDRLPLSHRQILQIAAVMGVSFSRLALQELSGLSANRFDVIVYDLIQWEYFYEDQSQLCFSKSLVQEILYQTQLKSHKQKWHEKIALYLESSLKSSELYDNLETLAHHYQHTAQREKALRYLYLSAQKAKSLFSNVLAQELLSQCLIWLIAEPSDTTIYCLDLNSENWVSNTQFVTQIKQELIDLAWLQGHYEQAHTLLDALLDEVSKAELQAALYHRKGRVYEKQSLWEPAMEMYLKGQDLLLEYPNSRTKVQLWNGSAWVAYRMGNYEEAKQFARMALELMQEEPYMRELAYAQNVLGVVHYHEKELDTALDYYQKSLEIQEQVSDIWGKGNTLSNMGSVYVMRNAWKEAIDLFQQSLELRTMSGDLDGQAVSCNNLGHIYQEIGAFDKAHLYIQRALHIYLSVGNKFGYTVAYCNLGLVESKLLQWESAELHLQTGLKLIHELKLTQILPEVQQGQIELYLMQRRTQDAEDILQDLAAQSEPTGVSYLKYRSICDFQQQKYAESLQNAESALQDPELSPQDLYLLQAVYKHNCAVLNRPLKAHWEQDEAKAQRALDQRQLQWLSQQLELFFESAQDTG